MGLSEHFHKDFGDFERIARVEEFQDIQEVLRNFRRGFEGPL